MSARARLSLFVGSFLAGCSAPLDETACLTVPLGDGCPSEAEASAALVGRGTCDGGPVRKIVETGALVSEDDGFTSEGSFVTDTGAPVTQCCYEAAYRNPPGGGSCSVGRPLQVDGRPVTAHPEPRSDWARGGSPSALDDRRAAAWTDAALLEHASIAAFARQVLDLVALGAPPNLIARTSAAIGDETVHAELCFALASAYGGTAVGPGRLPVPSRRRPRLRRLAVETFREGCVGETLAVALAAAQLREATDPAVRAALTRILDDESRHAELAWDTVRWAMAAGGPRVRRAIEREVAALALPAVPEGPLAHPATAMAALRGVMRDVIRPSAEALLAA